MIWKLTAAPEGLECDGGSYRRVCSRCGAVGPEHVTERLAIKRSWQDGWVSASIVGDAGGLCPQCAKKPVDTIRATRLK
jgi:hypothetical protein